MKLFHLLAGAAAAWILLLAACATDPAAQNEADASATAKQRCRRETPTGTTISVTRCRSSSDEAADRSGVDAMRDMARQGTAAKGSAGAAP
jgi:uncharacterized lipoprotein YajG